MNNNISKNHYAFVANFLITDNVLVSYEVTFSEIENQRQECFYSFKVDMSN